MKRYRFEEIKGRSFGLTINQEAFVETQKVRSMRK